MIAGKVEEGERFNLFEARYPLLAGLKVAIVIPTRNRAPYLAVALGSLAGAGKVALGTATLTLGNGITIDLSGDTVAGGSGYTITASGNASASTS